MEINNNVQTSPAFGAIAIKRNLTNPHTEINKVIHTCHQQGLFKRGLSKQNENYTILLTKQGSEEEQTLVSKLNKFGADAAIIRDKKARQLIDFYNKAKKILATDQGLARNPRDKQSLNMEYHKLFHRKGVPSYYIE